jgi:hypothetical protein
MSVTLTRCAQIKDRTSALSRVQHILKNWGVEAVKHALVAEHPCHLKHVDSAPAIILSPVLDHGTSDDYPTAYYYVVITGTPHRITSPDLLWWQRAMVELPSLPHRHGNRNRQRQLLLATRHGMACGMIQRAGSAVPSGRSSRQRMARAYIAIWPRSWLWRPDGAGMCRADRAPGQMTSRTGPQSYT